MSKEGMEMSSPVLEAQIAMLQEREGRLKLVIERRQGDLKAKAEKDLAVTQSTIRTLRQEKG